LVHHFICLMLKKNILAHYNDAVTLSFFITYKSCDFEILVLFFFYLIKSFILEKKKFSEKLFFFQNGGGKRNLSTRFELCFFSKYIFVPTNKANKWKKVDKNCAASNLNFCLLNIDKTFLKA